MLIKIINSIVKRVKRATINLPEFPVGTKFSIRYRFRRFFIPNKYFSAYLVSSRNVSHYLSNDPLDERVLEEILGSLNHLFFPNVSENVLKKLKSGGTILDIGAFNGGWGIEMLAKYPKCEALFFEPNPEKCINIHNSINKSNFISKSIIIEAGIAKKTGSAWLVKSKDGAWGDWLKNEQPQEESIEVKTITLKDAIQNIKPIVVKCNAEGGEFEFIQQLLDLKLKPQIMILMVHTEMGDVDLLYNNLLNSGYWIDKVKNHPRRPVWHLYIEEEYDK